MKPNKAPARILAWLGDQPAGVYCSLDQLCTALDLSPKRVAEHLSRLYAEGHLSRIGERTRYEYRLATDPVETTWKPDCIRPLVASLGVHVAPAMEWRRAA